MLFFRVKRIKFASEIMYNIIQKKMIKTLN